MQLRATTKVDSRKRTPSENRGTTHTSLGLITKYYWGQTIVYSLSICQLHTAAILNRHVQLLHPRAKNDIKAGTKCQVVGWGATDPEGLSLSDTLREVTVTVISRKTCNSRDYYNHSPVITRTMLCAGDARGQKDSCQVRIPHSNRHCRVLSYSQALSAHRRRGVASTASQLRKGALQSCTAFTVLSHLPLQISHRTCETHS